MELRYNLNNAQWRGYVGHVWLAEVVQKKLTCISDGTWPTARDFKVPTDLTFELDVRELTATGICSTIGTTC